MNKELFIITRVSDSEEGPNTDILGVYDNISLAREKFDYFIIKERDYCEDEEYDEDESSDYYELTNLDADYRVIIEIHHTTKIN